MFDAEELIEKLYSIKEIQDRIVCCIESLERILSEEQDFILVEITLREIEAQKKLLEIADNILEDIEEKLRKG